MGHKAQAFARASYCRSNTKAQNLVASFAVLSFCWSTFVWMARDRDGCPKHFLCIPNSVGGADSSARPYVEYSEVTQTAAVYRISSLLKTVQSPHQLVQAYESVFFGRIMVIDGALMLTERDEMNYHETLVHTTMNYLPSARRVLVVGGGDAEHLLEFVKRLARHEFKMDDEVRQRAEITDRARERRLQNEAKTPQCVLAKALGECEGEGQSVLHAKEISEIKLNDQLEWQKSEYYKVKDQVDSSEERARAAELKMKQEGDKARQEVADAQEACALFDEEAHPLDGSCTWRAVPKKEAVEDFVRAVVEALELDESTLVIALIFLERAMGGGVLIFCARTWRSALLTAIIVASKVVYDEKVFLADYYDQLPDLELSSAPQLEIAFLTMINYNVTVRRGQYAKYYYALEDVARVEAAAIE